MTWVYCSSVAVLRMSHACSRTQAVWEKVANAAVMRPRNSPAWDSNWGVVPVLSIVLPSTQLRTRSASSHVSPPRVFNAQWTINDPLLDLIGTGDEMPALCRWSSALFCASKKPAFLDSTPLCTLSVTLPRRVSQAKFTSS
jgi:hypothetical protein